MIDFKNDFKYVAMKAIFKRMQHVKTPEAIKWRRDARHYLENFKTQWAFRDLPTWGIDTEVFDSLQRQALSILITLSEK